MQDYAPRLAHLEWLLDSDPAIHSQVMRDLIDDAPDAIAAAESPRITTEGWGAKLLSLKSRRATGARHTRIEACLLSPAEIRVGSFHRMRFTVFLNERAETARVLITCTRGLESFLLEAGTPLSHVQPGPPSPDEIARLLGIAAKHGQQFPA